MADHRPPRIDSAASHRIDIVDPDAAAAASLKAVIDQLGSMIPGPTKDLGLFSAVTMTMGPANAAIEDADEVDVDVVE